MKRSITIEILTALLILLWVYTASSKLMDYGITMAQLERSPYIGRFADVLGWLLPVVEILTALLLTVRHTRKWGLWISMILLGVFTLYIAGLFVSGADLPCSCGGVIAALSWKQHLGFNLFFIMLNALALAYRGTQHIAIKRPVQPPREVS